MSIDIDWEALTTGTEGQALAENIRNFIDQQFQKITLPRFIKSVEVLGFEYGAVGPNIEIVDLADPLPDFYQGNGDEDGEDDAAGDEQEKGQKNRVPDTAEHELPEQHPRSPMPSIDTRPGALRSVFAGDNMLTPLGVSTPGILGYFALPRTGLSGTQTPLSVVAGRQMSVDAGVNASELVLRGPPSQRTSEATSRPSTAQSIQSDLSDVSREEAGQDAGVSDHPPVEPTNAAAAAADEEEHALERRATDVQIVLRVQYSGDVKLSLKAEILLDYPMPSFVGIPLRLNITGLSFRGTGILAWIQTRAHFCFLSPDDAAIIAGDEQHSSRTKRAGSLLEEIRIESEIGQRENGKQSLRNVDKVERFVVEQVRRMFEDELVYPNYWTFLI